MLEIADATVHHLQRFRGGGAAEVAALEQRHREPSLRGVPRGRGTGHSAADHEHVELPAGQGGQRPRHQASAPWRAWRYCSTEWMP
jgi:hypothetical protein